MLKRTAAIVLAATFLSLAIAPETLAQRYRRAGDRRSVATSYNSRGVAGTRYYAQPYYSGVGSRYYGQPYRSSVAGTRYYGQSYDRGYYGRYDRGRSTRNLALTVGAPAAIGAGIGALAGGGKGAGIGALVGGGGGALFYLLNNRRGRR
ncbi:MAG: hypothetical protein AABO57_10005 [Acidobacteriota bacterium]